MGKGILETFDLGFAIEIEVFNFAILSRCTDTGLLAPLQQTLSSPLSLPILVPG